MSLTDNYSSHQPPSQDLNPRRAPLPTADEHASYFPQQPHVGGYVRLDPTARQPQQQQSHSNDTASDAPTQPQARSSQSCGTDLDIAGFGSTVTAASLVAPGTMSTELGTVAGSGQGCGSAAAATNCGYRYSAVDDRQSAAAPATSNHHSPQQQQRQSQPYQQLQQPQQQSQQAEQAEQQQSDRQRFTPHAQYYAQEQATPVRQTTAAPQTSSSYHKLSPPQTSQPLVHHQSADRPKAQQPQQQQQQKSSNPQSYSQAPQQPQANQGYQYAASQVSPSALASSKQSTYQTTAATPSSASHATSAVQQHQRHPTSVNPNVLQQPRAYIQRLSPVTGVAQLPRPQASGQRQQQAEHTSAQSQQQHRGQGLPGVAQDSAPAPPPQQPQAALPVQAYQQQQQSAEVARPQSRQAPRKPQEVPQANQSLAQQQQTEQQAHQQVQQQAQQQQQRPLEDAHQHSRQAPREQARAELRLRTSTPANSEPPKTQQSPRLPHAQQPEAVKQPMQQQQQQQPQQHQPHAQRPVLQLQPLAEAPLETVQHAHRQTPVAATHTPAPVASAPPSTLDTNRAAESPQPQPQPQLQQQQQQNLGEHHPSGEASHVLGPEGGGPVDRALMEQRMRELVETMRFYQSKDPSTFHAVWESVRKEGVKPASGGESSQGSGSGSAVPAATPSTPAQAQSRIGAQGPVAKAPAFAPAKLQFPQLPVIPTQSRHAPPHPQFQPRLHPQPQLNRKSQQHSGTLTPRYNNPPPPPQTPGSQAPALVRPQSAMPEPEKLVVATAAAAFLTNSGKDIAVEPILEFLQHTNNFVIMCEYFDSLGYRYDRGDLARFLLDAVAQSKTKQGFSPSASPGAPGAPAPVQGPVRPGRVLGEVEDHQGQPMREFNSASASASNPSASAAQPTPAAIYQQAPYGTSFGSSPAPQMLLHSWRNGDGRPRKDGLPPGSVPKRSFAASSSPAHPTPFLPRATPTPISAPMTFSQTQTPTANHGKTSVLPRSNRKPWPTPMPVAAPTPYAQKINSRIPGTIPHGLLGLQAVLGRPTAFPVPASNVSMPPQPARIRQPPVGYLPTAFPNQSAAGDYPFPPAPFGDFGAVVDDATNDNTKPRQVISSSNKDPGKQVQNSVPAFAPSGIRTVGGRSSLLAAAAAAFSSNRQPATAREGPVIDLTGTRDSTAPAFGQSTMIKKTQEPKRRLAQRISRQKAARVSGYDPTNIARNILIVSQKHPTERSLNSHLMVLRERLPELIGWDSDLSTIRWDTLDPDPIALDNDVDMDGDDEGDGNLAPGAPMSVNGNRSAPAAPPAPTIPQKRPRGHDWEVREPALGSLELSGVDTSPGAGVPTALVTGPVMPLGRTKPAAAAPMSTPSHATSSRRLSGLRNNHSQPTAAAGNNCDTHSVISIHSHSATLNPAAHAMEPGPSSKRRRIDQLVRARVTPAFKKFRCKWKGCEAELHNIDNLKRHVRTHMKHNASGNGFLCDWAGCARPPMKEQIDAVKGRWDKLQPITWNFSSAEDWEKHVDGHVEAVKQSLGVGPAALLSDQESGVSDVDYLSDHTGQQITPTARLGNQDHKFLPPPGFKATRQFNIAHGISVAGNRRATSAGFRQVLERARLLGAGMEGDEVGDLLALDDGAGIDKEIKRIVSADWPRKKT